MGERLEVFFEREGVNYMLCELASDDFDKLAEGKNGGTVGIPSYYREGYPHDVWPRMGRGQRGRIVARWVDDYPLWRPLTLAGGF